MASLIVGGWPSPPSPNINPAIQGKNRRYDPDDDEVDSQDGDASDSILSDEDENQDEDESEEADEEADEDEDQDEQNDPADAAENEASVDNEGDEDNEADIGPQVDLDRVGCTDGCRKDFLRVVNGFERQVDELRDRIRNMTLESTRQIAERDSEINRKDAEIQALRQRLQARGNRQRHTQRTWPAKLRECMTRPDAPGALTYKDVYKLFCREENMSCKAENIHPNLRLRGPTTTEIVANVLPAIPEDEAEGELGDQDNDSVSNWRSWGSSGDPEDLFVQDDASDQAKDDHSQPASSFPFERLSSNVQANIIKFVFLQENKLIHCISRLDPFMPPDEVPQPNAAATGLLNRFHVSGTSCNISYAIRPDKHLALLSVCKRWYYLGIHAFYGLNTFAFSSLGEFGRFLSGIGQVRRERIQHIELLWIGNQHLVMPFVREGRRGQHLRYTSKRTWDLSWLCEMPRLRSLTIHINESGNESVRRKHESTTYKQYMASKTAGQPNFRLTRSLRTLQGLDYIHQLRGMEIIRFYDFEKHLKFGGRHLIRDWSFFMDVENVTAIPKTPEKAEAARLQNLTPVLPGFESHADDLEAVKELFKTSCAFDTGLLLRSGAEEDPQLENQPDDDASMSDGEIDSDGETSSSASGEATPRATARNARSVTAETDSDTARSDTKSEDDEVSLAGSRAENPIDIEHYEPKLKTPWRHLGGDEFKCESSISTSSSNELFVRQPSYDGRAYSRRRELSTGSHLPSPTPSAVREGSRDSGGLFVPSESPAAFRLFPQALPGAQSFRRESTTMTEIIRKRGFDEADVQRQIDLTGADEDDGPHINSSYMPNATSSQPWSSRPFTSGFDPLSSNPFSQPAGLQDDEEENPFKKKRKQW